MLQIRSSSTHSTPGHSGFTFLWVLPVFLLTEILMPSTLVAAESDAGEKCSGYYALCIAASCSSDKLKTCKEPSSYSYTNTPACTTCGNECSFSSANPKFIPKDHACGLCFVFNGESYLNPQEYNKTVTCEDLDAVLKKSDQLTAGDTVFSTFSWELFEKYEGFNENKCTVEGSADCMGMQCVVMEQTVQLKTKKGDWETVSTAECECVGMPQKGWPKAETATTLGGGGSSSNCESAVWSTFVGGTPTLPDSD